MTDLTPPASPSATPRENLDDQRKRNEQKNQRWIKVQEQAFTHWANETVQRRGMSVKDISVDLQTGIVLINFFELLSGKILRERYSHAPKNRIQMINNLHIALTFMERDMMVRNPGCSAEDIIDAEKFGNKLILGLLYTLFRIYRKKMREEDALLEWIRQTTEGYSGEHQFDYEGIAEKPVEEVLEYAFDFAQKHMGIDRLLEVEEVRDGDIDERALAIYASLFHHAFKTQKELEAMKNELGEASGELQFQMKSKNDLVKMNMEMTKQLQEMTEKKELMCQELESLNAQIEEVKASNDGKEALIKEIDEKIEAYKKEIDTYNGKIKELTVKNNELEDKLKKLEEDHQKDDERKTALTNELKALKEELEKLENELRVEEELKNGADIASKFEEQSKTNKKLEDEILELEEQFEEFESVSKNLRKNLEDIEGDKSGVDDGISTISKEAEQYTGALSHLKKQIELHADDLQRWSGMLEGKSSVGDVEGQIMKLKNENDELTSQERVAKLLDLLEKENDEINKLYTQKLDEVNNPKTTTNKKKPTAKKPKAKK
ncbi:Alpha-actinin [Entamoeba marina]